VIFYGLVGSNVCKILPNIDKTSKNKEVYEEMAERVSAQIEHKTIIAPSLTSFRW